MQCCAEEEAGSDSPGGGGGGVDGGGGGGDDGGGGGGGGDQPAEQTPHASPELQVYVYPPEGQHMASGCPLEFDAWMAAEQMTRDEEAREQAALAMGSAWDGHGDGECVG